MKYVYQVAERRKQTNRLDTPASEEAGRQLKIIVKAMELAHVWHLGEHVAGDTIPMVESTLQELQGTKARDDL